MKRILQCLACLLAFALQSVAAEDVDVAASELPKPVSDAVIKQFPQATIIAAEKETAHGETLYRVKFKVLETLGQCVVTPDGIVKERKEHQKGG
jgi:hypothetical protein